jgi:hypothetical protein
MNDQGRQWFEELQAFIDECRAERPIPEREALSSMEEMQCRIIGGCLISWLQEHGPRMIQERAVLSKTQNWEEDPFIVFTSQQPGLAAAQEILEDAGESVAFLHPEEFTQWLENHPDPDYVWHVHTWSYFAPVEEDMAEEAKEHPVAEGETLWLHKEGTYCGTLFGRGGDHLWKWDGKELTLLEEGIHTWIS